MKKRIISIGYERRSIEEFIHLLKECNVVRLIDIRQNAASRRPDFNKLRLQGFLETAGIEYIHVRMAGNPFHKEATQDRTECLERYGQHLAAHPVISKTVITACDKAPVALLCYERYHVDCHRSILIRFLEQQGHDIEIVRVDDGVPGLGATQDSYLGEDSSRTECNIS